MKEVIGAKDYKIQLGSKQSDGNERQETIFAYWNREDRDNINTKVPQNKQATSSGAWHWSS